MNRESQHTSQKEPKLSIRLMGEPQIFLGEDQPVQFQYRKSIALLAFLAATQRAYSREYLADFLWRDLPEKNAQASLRKTISDINKLIPNFLTNENHNIALSISPCVEVDSFSLEEAVLALRPKSLEEISRAEIGRLADLLPFCQEPFMNAFFVQKAPAFENWLLLHREYLLSLLGEALLKISNYTYRNGQYQEAMEYTRQLLQIEPAHEDAHYNLMSLYAINDQRTLALNQFEICKESLMDTFGSSPNQKLVELYNRIRSEKENQSITRTLPVPSMPIYGREEDIQNVLSRLQQDKCRILTIMGPGGIGKTHLALMVGKEINKHVVDHFKDGVIFVSLQALNSIHSLSSSIAHQLGYTYEKESDPVDQLCDFLAPYKMVLILDNFEQLVVSLKDFHAEQFDLINRVLRAAPGVKLLITSRIRLNFQGEFVYPLQGISFPENEERETQLLRNYPAVSLFIQRADQLAGQYDPDEEELQGIIDICQSVNGLPLGILLAAGWTNLLTAREIAKTIKNGMGSKGLEFLATGGHDMPERHRDMDSVFRQSWDMISVKQRETLAALSFLPSSFSIEIAREVAQADLSDLKVLLDHSLLDRKSSGRLQMHDLLRLYASNQGVDTTGVCERTCHYYGSKIAEWEKALKSSGQVQAIHEMNLEIDNLRAIWDQIVENRNFTCASKLLEGMCLYYTWRHYYSEAINFCEQLVQKLEETQEFEAVFSIQDAYRLLAKTLTWQASFIKLDEAGAYLSRSMKILDDPILEGCDIRSERAFASYWMAANSSQTGKFEDAIHLYKTSKNLYENLQDEWHLKDLCLAKGIMYWDRSEYSDGKKSVEESLAISRKIGDKRGIANALLWLGNIELFLGDPKGEKKVRESLAIFYELGEVMSGRSGAVQASSSLFILGMYEEACELMEQNNNQNAYDFRQDSSNTIFAISLIHTGQYEKARQFIERGVNLAQALGEAHGENLALHTLAWFRIYEQDFEKAEQILKETLQNSQKHSIKELESWSYTFLTMTALLMKKGDDLLPYLQKAFQIADSINSFTAKVFALGCLSLWLCLHGHLELGYAAYIYAWQYPLLSNSVWWKDQAGTTIEAPGSKLTGDEIEQANTRFNGLSLEEVISRIMDEVDSPVSVD